MNSEIKIGYPLPKQKFNYKINPIAAAFYSYHPYFSFRYFHKNHTKFNLKNFKNTKEFIRFFERLEAMSQDTWKIIFTKKRDYYHAHEVDWERTDIKNGFCHLPNGIQESPAYQFKVFDICRVFGFFNQHNVFKIVWIDRDHEAHPTRKK